MKSLMSGQKKAIKTAEVKYLYAPQYSTLSLEKLLGFALQFQDLEVYLPEERDIPILPR